MAEPEREFGETADGATYALRPGGYAVAFNGAGEVAVVRTSGGLFLPGGGQEGGEAPGPAAIRKAREECGLRVRLGPRLGVADELVFAREEEAAHFRKRCSFFLAEAVSRGGPGQPDHELAWMAPEEAASRLRHESQRWAVRRACRPGFGDPYG